MRRTCTEVAWTRPDQRRQRRREWTGRMGKWREVRGKKKEDRGRSRGRVYRRRRERRGRWGKSYAEAEARTAEVKRNVNGRKSGGHRWMKKQKDIDDGGWSTTEQSVVVSANRRAPRRKVVTCERKKERRERRTKTANFATVMVVKLLTGSQ